MKNTTPFSRPQRRWISLLVLLAHLGHPVLVSAQIILNAGTPNDGRRAFVDQTQSGLSKVNIATPNGAGVSHNTYQQFDVPVQGVILNNGATNSNTRLAGWVEGNPNLRPGQEARLILNEVVGAAPSTLQGYLEVAGRKADVVVANERGVTCNGCGFINTDRATLTTGWPELAADGSLARLNVQAGQIEIGANGLQAADSQVDLLSRYVNVQGEIHAQQLRAVTGAHLFDYGTAQITTQASAADAANPAGLDVGQLGGMYANQIRLVATGQGVGVRVDGRLLSAGQISIQADGTLVHSGQLQADQGAQLQAARLEQRGQIISAQNVGLQAQSIEHSGSTQALKIELKSDQNIVNTGLIAAQSGGLKVQAGGVLDNRSGGTLYAQGANTVQAQSIVNAGQISADTGALDIRADVLQNTGSLTAAGHVDIGVQQLQQNGKILTEGRLTIEASDVRHSGQTQAEQLAVHTHTLTNNGQLQVGSGGGSVAADTLLDNQSTAQIVAKGALALNANTIINAGRIDLQSDSQIQAQTLRNQGVLQAQAGLSLQATQLDNSATLTAGQLHLQGDQMSNTGRIQAEQLGLSGQDASRSVLVNSGELVSRQMDIGKLQQLSNSGRISTAVANAEAPQNLNIQATRLLNSTGRIEAQDALTIHAGQLDNRAGQIVTRQGSMDVRADTLDNRSGTLLQQGDAASLRIQADAALNNSSGQIEGQGQHMTVQAGEIANNSGQLLHTAIAQSGQAAPVLDITAQASAVASGQLQNIQGRISASGDVRIQAQAYITDASDKRLSEAKTLPFMDKAKAQSGSAPASTGYNWEADIAANNKVNSTKAAADKAATDAAAAATALTQAQSTLGNAQTAKSQTATQLSQAQSDWSQAQAAVQSAQAAAAAKPGDATLAQAALDAQVRASAAQKAMDQAQLADLQAQAALSQAQTGVTTAQADKTAADAALASAQAAYQAALAEVKPITPGSTGNAGSSDSAKPGDLQLNTPTLPASTLAGAQTLAAGDMTLTLGDGGLDNRQGRLQARNITIQTSGDAWTHQISAQEGLTLQARNVEADSTVQANTTRITASAQLSNSGRIEGTQSLTLDAQSVQNTGTLYGRDTTVQARDALLNTGWVQGLNTLNMEAADLFNASTLAGGQVSIRGQQRLENTGVLFANTGMTLQGADIANNQARIHSMGDLRIEGAQPGQNASSVFNYAGRIESAGDLNIQADTLTNRAVLPSVNPRGLVEHIRDGGNIITRATDTFNADGKKAEIIAGKSLSVAAKTVNNDYGILSAWHQVNVTADTINNTAYGAVQTENMVVKAACYNCHQTVRYANSWGGVIESGGAANLRALVLNNKTVDTRDGFAGLSNDPRVVIVDERSGTQSPLTKAFVDRFGIVSGPASSNANGSNSALSGQRQILDGLTLNAYGGLDFSRFKLPDGSGLFQRADPASPYLIQGRTDLIPKEANAQNTNYNRFLGSDYLLTRLGLIPGGVKRLGDAWYETQLVQEQLYALSGRRYAVASTTSDYDLMHSLMDAGLLAQAQLGLTAGTPLSEAQRAALSKDIVWPEWQEVDGQRVLVPRVYLAQASIEQAQGQAAGARITGRDVDVQVGALLQQGGHIAADNALSINASGNVSGSGSYSGGKTVAIVAGSVDLQSASLQSGGWLQLQTTQGDLNLTATQVAAQGDAQVQSAAALSLNAQQHEAHVVRGNGSRKDETQFETSNIQAGGSLLLQSAGDLTAQGSRLSAGKDLAAVSTEGELRIDSPQNYTRTQIGADVRQSLQSERAHIEAGGNVTLYGQEALALTATRVNAGGNASVSSQGDVALGANTDTEQHNWTTSSTSRSWGGLQKKTTTTQHEQLDQEAERTQISAGGQAQVLGKNVASVGAQVSGQTLTQIEGADKTLLYDVQEVHQYSANSQTRSSFAGITYSKSSSNDSTFKSEALPTELKSEEAVRVGVGAVTDVRGAILSAPQVGFYRSAGADPSTPGQLILGASTDTTQTTQTEKTTTAGVWQAQSGQGSTTQTAKQTQVNGNLNIGPGIATTLQIPEGALKSQIEALSQQPGKAYLAELAKNPNVNWQQIKLAHDEWSYSQQGLTGAGAALLAIAIAAYTGGMGTNLLGTTSTAATGASTTTLAGATLASTTAATATTAAVTTYTAAGAAINAGFSALAAQAGVALVNNGGDIGKTLQDLGSSTAIKNTLTVMISAGVGNAVAGQGVSAVAAQTVAGCATGAVTRAGCDQGAKTAAVLSTAGETYQSLVGYAANAGPGENRPGSTTGNGAYEPIRVQTSPNYGQQLPADQGMNVIGLNEPGSLLSQGGTVSRALNQVPFINAIAGLHDYIFNANPDLNFTFWNVPTMLPAAAAAIPASLNNPNIHWLTQIKLPSAVTKLPVPASVIRVDNPVPQAPAN